MEIKFQAYSPFIKQLRMDKGFRLEMDISADQYDAIKDLPKLDEEVLEVTIKIGK